jgi:hypothetical protein
VDSIHPVVGCDDPVEHQKSKIDSSGREENNAHVLLRSSCKKTNEPEKKHAKEKQNHVPPIARTTAKLQTHEINVNSQTFERYPESSDSQDGSIDKFLEECRDIGYIQFFSKHPS